MLSDNVEFEPQGVGLALAILPLWVIPRRTLDSWQIRQAFSERAISSSSLR